MNATDLEIQRRLNKLKEDRPPVPSEQELRSRLQKLKGEKPSTLTNRYVLLPDVRTDAEQVDYLMKKYSEEASLQKRYTTPVSDIEQRLNDIKMFTHSSSGTEQQMSNETSRKFEHSSQDDVLEKLNKKVPLMACEEIESMECSKSYPQEYFCYICDRVPKWICHTCDDQLFCNACYKEYHEDEDTPHRRKLFNARRMQSDSDSD